MFLTSLRRRPFPRRSAVLLIAALAGLALLAGCDRGRTPVFESTPAGPVEAVQQLVDDLRRDDLAAYARHAVPAELHGRLAHAWAEGRTLWPLTELPLEDRFQGFLVDLAAPGSEQRLLQAYRRQFAGADAEIRAAIAAVGLFTTQYVSTEADYGPEEQDHYVQLVAALGLWGRTAPLGDLAHARRAVPQLTQAARATGLGTPDGLRRTGMERSLKRLGPFAGRLKRVLAGYGLDIDQALDGMRISLASQTGDRAKVRLQYTLDGRAVDAFVLLERRDGRWYLSDLLRRAETEAEASARPAAPDAAPPRPVAPPPATTPRSAGANATGGRS